MNTELHYAVPRLKSIEFLDSRKVPYQTIEFADPPHTVADVQVCCSCKIEEVLKSVLLVEDNHAVLAVVPGDSRVNIEKLRKCVNRQKLKMATPQQVLQITSSKIGAVSPFGLQSEVQIVTDKKLFDTSHVYAGSGEGTVLLKLATSDLKAALLGNSFDITST